MSNFSILQGDSLTQLREMPDESVNCIVTSPPYWGLRDYGVDGQIGLEPSIDEWLDRLVAVFNEAKRVLHRDGTCWVEMGDNHVNKQLQGQPWRLALAMQESGWILRRDIILHKPNPMPESAKDRFTTAHSYLFHLVKSTSYHFDQNAVKEPVSGNAHARGTGVNPKASGWDTDKGSHGTIHKASLGNKGESGDRDTVRSTHGSKFGRGKGWRSRQNESFSGAVNELVDSRNRRSVIAIPIQPYSGAHFATFSPEIPKLCILAGCPEGGTVLDPFLGSGTTLAVAIALGRKGIGIELNPEYIKLAEKRLSGVTPGFCFTEGVA